MASNFPGTSVDTFATLTDGVSTVLAAHQNDRAAAIVAVQTKVGVDADTLSATTLEGRAKFQETGGLKRGSSVASASSITLAAAAQVFPITGAVTIATIVSPGYARLVYLEFASALTLTHGSGNLTLPGAVDLAVAAGSVLALEWTGSTWRVVGGSGSGSSFATPAIVLGTTAAAGAASTTLRSDSTIVAFDATVPSTQAIGDSAATGSAAVAARRDHQHAMPAYGTTSGTVAQGNDSRFTDSRAPSGTAGGDLAGTYPNPTVASGAITDTKVASANKDGTTGVPSLRTLGTGAQQAAAGNHSHGGGSGDATSVQGVAVDATLDTTDGNVLTYVSGSTQLELLPPSGAGTSNGVYSGRPAAGTAGQLFLPSDGYGVQRDTGAAWAPWGPLFPLTAPPLVAAWTAVNLTGSAVDDRGAITLTGVTSAGNNTMGLFRAAPATPYTVLAYIIPTFPLVNFLQTGVMWYDGTKLAGLVLHATTAGLNVQTFKLNSVTSFSASYSDTLARASLGYWVKLTDDGTNRTMSYGLDSRNWILVTSVTRTDFLTPTHVGFTVDNAGGTPAPIGLLLSWSGA